MSYSDYIVYVDESGDHGLESINPLYPMFVLAFCIFKKSDYINEATPALQDLKFRHFGHDMVVLHERDIRKARGDFVFLVDREKRSRFMKDLTKLVESTEFAVIASCIHKQRHASQYTHPANPYSIALVFGLERLFKFHQKKAQHRKTLHVVVESRGRKEDGELELAFRRICDGQNYSQDRFPFRLVFADKKRNSTGLQIADMIARPIGRHVLKPDQPNRAYEIIEQKFDRWGGRIQGCGLKVFP